LLPSTPGNCWRFENSMSKAISVVYLSSSSRMFHYLGMTNGLHRFLLIQNGPGLPPDGLKGRNRVILIFENCFCLPHSSLDCDFSST
jgi:hypothetical protein